MLSTLLHDRWSRWAPRLDRAPARHVARDGRRTLTRFVLGPAVLGLVPAMGHAALLGDPAADGASGDVAQASSGPMAGDLLFGAGTDRWPRSAPPGTARTEASPPAPTALTGTGRLAPDLSPSSTSSPTGTPATPSGTALSPTGDEVPVPSPGRLQRAWHAVDQHVGGTWRDGSLDLYVLGYAWHGRGDYSSGAYHALNQQAWGVGLGKHLTDAKGNEDLIYAFGFADSHDHFEPIVGYAHQWFTDPVLGGLEVGAGYTVGITSRVDIFSGVPFPLALPVVSLKYRRFSLMATGLPKVSGVNDGTVILTWGRYEF